MLVEKIHKTLLPMLLAMVLEALASSYVTYVLENLLCML